MTYNRVILTMTGLALAAALLLNFITFQPNRIAPGQEISLLTAAGLPATLLLMALLGLMAALSWRPSRDRYLTLLLLTTLTLIGLPLAVASYAHQHLPADMPYARVGLGSGFWCMGVFLALLVVETSQRLAQQYRLVGMQWLVTAATVIGLWLLGHSGALDRLSLLQEYSQRQAKFAAELQTHLLLAGAAVLIALLCGIVLAIAAQASVRLRQPLFQLLNLLQTIPSLALFGLLMVPLSYLAAHSPLLQALNVRGIGWAPALIALVGYSLLPITRNTFVALQEVPAQVLDAARGMGMAPMQIFLAVRLPLALPVIIEGIRITLIQAIGLTSVAALIGAGGLGTFIFQGLGQAAMDLVLLGAIPTIVLALLADVLLGLLTRLCHREPTP
ncbi:hypothetical protein WH50_00635 [Pokkaliibacter plantistimulans]|uniref:ABC transmembrane type-1 domain-containing protein n=1 Tax=Pokkaliibacter plantistimulans TaxID=1635171 RepID=A0ABX5M2E2_9GAMM|nr:ABC transporter permease [Pokkaliibacter plantistimulans]PXF33069.1 hypothetical protein WH50_00635 [Pokkaliibacter plantistimulans]